MTMDEAAQCAHLAQATGAGTGNTGACRAEVQDRARAANMVDQRCRARRSFGSKTKFEMKSMKARATDGGSWDAHVVEKRAEILLPYLHCCKSDG